VGRAKSQARIKKLGSKSISVRWAEVASQAAARLRGSPFRVVSRAESGEGADAKIGQSEQLFGAALLVPCLTISQGKSHAARTIR